MYWPKPSTPKSICISPARMTVVNTSDRSPLSDAKTPAKTTIIGPVGPDICDGVPPNRAAKKPTNIAPYTPAMGPAPEASPKARARGSATTPAVNPPKMSPRRCERSKKRFMVSLVLRSGVCVHGLTNPRSAALFKKQRGWLLAVSSAFGHGRAVVLENFPARVGRHIQVAEPCCHR